jgi:hypothetical protein
MKILEHWSSKMRISVLIVASIVIQLISFPVKAQQPPPLLDCAFWDDFGKTSPIRQEDRALVRMLYILGVSDGISMGLLATGMPEAQALQSRNKAWPAGLSAERVRALVDQYCEKPENQSKSVIEAIYSLTKEINDRRR